MPAGKRGLEDETESTPDTPHKRRRTQKPLTQQVQESIRDLYGAEIDLVDIAAMSCYLIVILSWGFAIRETDLDAFIALHPKFLRELPQLEEAQCGAPSWLIPAYHQWFAEQDLLEHGFDSGRPQIINEKLLRGLGEESPYTCRLAELILDNIQRTRP